MHLIKYRKLINSKIFIMLLIFFLWLVADNMLEFVFPTYLERINKSYFEIGFLLSLVALCGMMVDLPAGYLCDKISRRKIMIAGLAISIIAAVLIFAFNGDIPLAFAFLFWGMAYQLWRVPKDAQYAALTQKEKRAAQYGLETEVRYLGQILGPLIGGFVFLYLSFTGVLNIYIGLLILAILVIVLAIKETNNRSVVDGVSKSARWSAIITELKEFKIFGVYGVVLLYFSLLFTAWEQILWTFEPLFYGPSILNIPPHMGGLLLAFFSIPGLLLAYPAGKLADKYGKKLILLIGLMIMGSSLIVFSLAKNLYLVFGIVLLISVGWAFSIPALNGLIVDISYRQKKGKLAGIWDFSTDIGYMAGPLLGGVIAQLSGLRNVFLIMGLLFLFSSVSLPFLKATQSGQKLKTKPIH